jgi:hypothetical protein
LHWSQETKLYIRNLERAIDALKDLQASATRLKKDLAVDMKIRYLHEGILLLPDEVLRNILTISHYEDGTNLFRMARVCRCFRDIVFSHAPFWNYISTSSRLEAVDTALLRSKQVPLAAWVSGLERIPGKSTTFLKKIQAHAHRLTTLSVDFSESIHPYKNPAPEWQAIGNVLRLLSESEFHSLTEFSFSIPRPYVDEEENEGLVLPALAASTDDDSLHVYLNWHLSSMKHLLLCELVPRVHPELALSTLQLEFRTNWRLPERPLTQLMAFIKTQSRLQQLVLTIGSLEEQDFVWEDTIHMPDLHTLYMKTPEWSDHYLSSICPVPQIFQHLSTPSAEQIVLQFPVQTDDFSLETIFVQNYPRLAALSLELSRKDMFELGFAPFRFFFSRFPLLTYFTLELQFSSIRHDVPDPSAHPPPPLKELVLSNIDDFGVDELKKVIEYLGSGERDNSLEGVRTRGCHGLRGSDDQIESLKQLLPNCKFDARF